MNVPRYPFYLLAFGTCMSELSKIRPHAIAQKMNATLKNVVVLENKRKLPTRLNHALRTYMNM